MTRLGAALLRVLSIALVFLPASLRSEESFFENRTIIAEQKTLEKDTGSKLEAFMKKCGITDIPPGDPTVESLFLALPDGENLYRKGIDLVTTPIADGLDDAQKQILARR